MDSIVQTDLNELSLDYAVETEARFKQNSYVDNCCLIMMRKAYPVMLIWLSKKAQQQEKKNVEKSFKKTFSSANKDLPHGHKVSQILILDKTIEGTEDMDSKRANLETIYEEKVNQIMENPAIILWG